MKTCKDRYKQHALNQSFIKNALQTTKLHYNKNPEIQKKYIELHTYSNREVEWQILINNLSLVQFEYLCVLGSESLNTCKESGRVNCV